MPRPVDRDTLYTLRNEIERLRIRIQVLERFLAAIPAGDGVAILGLPRGEEYRLDLCGIGFMLPSHAADCSQDQPHQR